MTSGSPAPASSNGISFEQDFHVRATEARGRLSSNDDRIVEHLREHMSELPFHTSDSLADAIGVSRAAVVRFATKIGYENFSEMRQRARDELREGGNSPLSRFAEHGSEEPVSALQRILRQGSRNLEMTETLSGDALAPAALALHSAQTIYVVGNRKSYALAVYLHRILSGLRPGVRLVDPAFMDDAAELGPDDAIVACLFQRYSRSTIAILEMAKSAQGHTIVLTDGRGHPFVDGVEHVLVAATDSPTLYSSMVAPIALLEALSAQVAALDPERTRRSLEAVERFNVDQRLLLE